MIFCIEYTTVRTRVNKGTWLQRLKNNFIFASLFVMNFLLYSNFMAFSRSFLMDL